MANHLRRVVLLAMAALAAASLQGCLISNLGSSSSGGVTTLQATVTLTQPSPCAVDAIAQTTTCNPVMQVGLPGGASQSFTFAIELLGYAAPLTLYDPLIVQVPASMSNFAGSIAAGPPGVAPATPLSIISGLSSVPIDASTNLIAEPGMQLVVIDFAAPADAPIGTYTLNLQFSGSTDSIKVVFAAKVQAGAQTYYVPIYPCVTNFANVSPITLPVTNIAGIIPVILSTQGCDGKQYNFAGLAPPGVELDQQGLTGSWYEPATSGQGLELEIYPNLASAGVGLAQLAWFTFDTTAGAADRQRWYTLSGQVATGNPSASLTIYENIGGNFNAPPVTNAVAVGTATLSFDSCTSGTLTYRFTDGSGRSGTVPLSRITQNETCVAAGAAPTNADFAFSGNWYDAATSGQGFTVEVNPASGVFFFAWYTYAPNGAGAGASGQRWYTGQAAFTAGTRTIPFQIYQTTGGVFDTPTPASQQTTQVGSGTIVFTSCTSATLNYTFTGGSASGMSGAIDLSRVGPAPAGCVN
ncbi:MAG TPA: hypothetical protein VKV24_16930 [Casimicrobiaceae bacterium]|nr:hypothetical protein [Casimicrobiaceae bacterium]